MKYLERNCVGLSVGGDLYKDYCYLEFSEDEKKVFFKNENDYKELKEIKNKYINIIKGKRDGKENFRREKRGLQRIGKKDFCRYKERAWHCR